MTSERWLMSGPCPISIINAPSLVGFTDIKASQFNDIQTIITSHWKLRTHKMIFRIVFNAMPKELRGKKRNIWMNRNSIWCMSCTFHPVGGGILGHRLWDRCIFLKIYAKSLWYFLKQAHYFNLSSFNLQEAILS